MPHTQKQNNATERPTPSHTYTPVPVLVIVAVGSREGGDFQGGEASCGAGAGAQRGQRVLVVAKLICRSGFESSGIVAASVSSAGL